MKPKTLSGMDFDKILKLTLAGRKFVRPPVAFTEHLRDDVGKRHIPTFQREKRLIHLRIDSYRTSLACTRHNNHFVVT